MRRIIFVVAAPDLSQFSPVFPHHFYSTCDPVMGACGGRLRDKIGLPDLQSLRTTVINDRDNGRKHTGLPHYTGTLSPLCRDNRYVSYTFSDTILSCIFETTRITSTNPSRPRKASAYGTVLLTILHLAPTPQKLQTVGDRSLPCPPEAAGYHAQDPTYRQLLRKPPDRRPSHEPEEL